MRKRIWLMGLLAEALAGALAFALFSPLPDLTGELAERLAVVCGLGPAPDALPSLWAELARLLPPTAGAFGLAGRFGAALFAALACAAFKDLLVILARPSDERFLRLIAPPVSLAGALAMTFAAPVWRLFALLTPAGVQLLGCQAVVTLFTGRLAGGGNARLYLASFLLTLLAFETPFAPILLLALVLAFFRLLALLGDSATLPEPDYRSLLALPVVRMLACSFLGLLAVLALASARGRVHALLTLETAAAYAHLAATAAKPLGWTLVAALGLLPLVAALALYARFADDDQRLSPAIGTVVFLLGAVAYLEQGPFHALWFGAAMGDSGLVRSPLLLALFSVTATSAALFASGVFAYDIFCPVRSRPRGTLVTALSRTAFLAALLAATLALNATHTDYSRIAAFNARVVRETVREANGARWLFTDGTADAALELEAHRRGETLSAMNLLGDAPRRKRGLSADDDRLAASLGPSVLMRTWALDGKRGLADAALQAGLVFWKRERELTPPAASAFVARTSGLRGEDVAHAPEIAARFADEIFALSPVASSPDVPTEARTAFFRHSWRLARLARYRGEDELAERLENCNALVRQMRSDLEGERFRVFMQTTPREGLELALKRADFADAARHAATVLRRDAADARANFAVGMHLLLRGNLYAAEPYLRKVLEVNSNEVAVLNNLSILCRKTQRTDEARALADRALALQPENSDVMRTHAAAWKER